MSLPGQTGSFECGLNRSFHIRTFGNRDSVSCNKKKVIAFRQANPAEPYGFSHQTSCSVAHDAVSDLLAGNKCLSGKAGSVGFVQDNNILAAGGLALLINGIEISSFSKYEIILHNATIPFPEIKRTASFCLLLFFS